MTEETWFQRRVTENWERIQFARETGYYPYFHPFENIGVHVTDAGRPIVNFSSNDYLGLSQDKRVIKAAQDILPRFGTGLGSSRLQATSVEHLKLEEELAAWQGYPACMVFTTGYQALVGVMTTLADEGDTTIVLDNLAHASILDGSFLAKGKPGCNPEIRVCNHNSAKALKRILSGRKFPHAFVVVEGLYSMDGDMLALTEMHDVCKEHGALFVVDDAHGTGTLGKGGRGVAEHFGRQGQVDVLVSTFSKSLGAIGGFVCASKELIEFIKHHARSFMFSASPPASIVATAREALRILQAEPQLVTRLHENAAYMKQALLQAGFDLAKSETHIAPIMIRDEMKCLTMAKLTYEHGVYFTPIVYPGVLRGQERLRCNITATHSREDMDKGVEVLLAAAKEVELWS